MNSRNSWIVVLCVALASPAAHAQSTLDKYLKRSTQGDASTATDKVEKVFEGPSGYWRVDDNRAGGGSCSVTYEAGPNKAGYVAPTSGSDAAFIVFSGPAIPPTKAGKNRKMTLYTSSNGQAQAVEAFHAPNTAEKGGGIIFFRLTDIEAAMADISDVEDIVASLDEAEVFAIAWQGGHKARAAMQECLRAAPRAASATP
ncbi:hypothetical protein [Blastomonas fulva]|uniref:hypothetical protein n=1 Tax=Blastomonas fulva TaxID=1550728 RepID=UPI003F6E74A3